MRTLACLLFVAICLCISAEAALRIYYVQAEEVEWNYAPSGMNNLAGVPLADDVHSAHYFKKSDKVIGGTFIKAIYVQYTDGSFTTKKKRDDREEHLGILGPILYGEVGDTIQVVFSNAASFNFSIHPHGVFYSKESEGAKYPDGAFPAGDFIAPGTKYTYSWPVPARAGPGPGDFSSVVWPYHTHVSEVFSSVSGLVGVFVITSKGQAWPDGRPKEVDREFVLFLQVFNENNSGYLPMNIAKYLPDQVNNPEIHLDPVFIEANKLTSINGYCFGNLPGLHMKAGERVRWYVYALGAEEDIHTIHWHGNTLLDRQHRTTTEIILPATVVILDMIPDNVGRWNVQCHVNEHITAGQVANYTVEAVPHYMDSNRNFATTRDPFSFLFSPEAPVIIINDATSMFAASFCASLVFVCMLFAVL